MYAILSTTILKTSNNFLQRNGSWQHLYCGSNGTNSATKLVAVFDEILRWDSPANFLFSKTLLQYPCDLTTQLLNIAAPSPKNYGGCASYLQITTGWTSRCTTTTTLFDHI
jgi:hypothetical protein